MKDGMMRREFVKGAGVPAGVLCLVLLAVAGCGGQAKRERIMGPYHFQAELTPGVRLFAMLPRGTQLAPTYFGMCTYLIAGEAGRYVLVDTGDAGQTEALVGMLGEAGVRPEDIEMVACTHSHSDHVGGCAFFQKAGAKIAIHEVAGEVVDSTPPFRNADVVDSASAGWEFEAFRPDVRFADGDVLKAAGIELRVLHTPGHTPDSSSFVLERAGRKVLFVGDINGWYIIEWGSNQRQMLASVRKVRQARADYVCFGHRVVNDDLEEFWERLEASVGDGIFQLVDQHDYDEHVVRTGERVLKKAVGIDY
jgi:glyoxylase-like metal-dependent hydrolase (beta-lactamase superfamily II)